MQLGTGWSLPRNRAPTPRRSRNDALIRAKPASQTAAHNLRYVYSFSPRGALESEETRHVGGTREGMGRRGRVPAAGPQDQVHAAHGRHEVVRVEVLDHLIADHGIVGFGLLETVKAHTVGHRIELLILAKVRDNGRPSAPSLPLPAQREGWGGDEALTIASLSLNFTNLRSCTSGENESSPGQANIVNSTRSARCGVLL